MSWQKNGGLTLVYGDRDDPVEDTGDPVDDTGDPADDTDTPDDTGTPDDTVDDDPADAPSGSSDPGACGCATPASPGGWALALLLLVAARRRPR